MKRISSLLFYLLLLESLSAQPTVSIPEEIYNVGESICVPVKVKDFTDITTMNFSITWDIMVINLTNIAINNPIFNDALNTDLVDSGILTATFSSPNIEGSTIMDNGIPVRLIDYNSSIRQLLKNYSNRAKIVSFTKST